MYIQTIASCAENDNKRDTAAPCSWPKGTFKPREFMIPTIPEEQRVTLPQLGDLKATGA